MPKLKVGDIDIYHEIYGDGAQTLVMIRGLGSDLCAWYEQTPVLSRVFRLLQLDNRGAGRSDKPTAPYSIRQMAADTKGLMDSLRCLPAELPSCMSPWEAVVLGAEVHDEERTSRRHHVD
jgi:pimeloyl-ACP methyl ester carboxylesterase